MPNKHEKYFKILELDIGASKEDVKKAFRELSHIWHPDNHMGKSSNVQNRATEKFSEISNAYQALNDYLGGKEKEGADQERREKEEKEYKYWEEQAKKKHEEEKSKQKKQECIYARCPECKKKILVNPTVPKSEACEYCGQLYYSFFSPNGELRVVSDTKGNERRKKEEERREKEEKAKKKHDDS